MSENTVTAHDARQRQAGSETTTFAILVSLSVCHLLNDMNQSLVPALYPILKDSYRLDFGQIGLITLAFQLTASMLQPVVGMVTDDARSPIRCRSPWASAWSACCCCRWPTTIR